MYQKEAGKLAAQRVAFGQPNDHVKSQFDSGECFLEALRWVDEIIAFYWILFRGLGNQLVLLLNSLLTFE